MPAGCFSLPHYINFLKLLRQPPASKIVEYPKMGLQNELEDMACDSLPILLLTIIATAVRHLRAAVFTILHRIPVSEVEAGVSYGLASLIVNRAWSNEMGDEVSGSDCVICLCELSTGERVRRLDCSHMFHNKCLDAWLKQLPFTCPICRSPVPMPSSTSPVS